LTRKKVREREVARFIWPLPDFSEKGPRVSHEPVLCQESIAYLLTAGSGIYVDATLGAGGHAEYLLTHSDDTRLIGIDQDPAALRLARSRLSPFGDRVSLISGNFAHLPDLLAGPAPDGVQGILLDLGVSSMQIDQPERGFSYMQDGPLDMRMDPDLPDNAGDILSGFDRGELAHLLRVTGEVKRPGKITDSIIERRDAGEMSSTADLRRAVEAVIGTRDSFGELSRVFQALRIEVNRELSSLEQALETLPAILAEGGVAVIISYHSLEDRRVKRFFKRECLDCICSPKLPICTCGHTHRFEMLNKKIVRAGEAEQSRNPRARSARLRVAKRSRA
jgi:16S rRNA (cytosine1402-N4)-methyltransferase